ncbi:MAG: outer membrane beta-barrel protein [Deltaproteobacteria bacterium]|nr:outer membrane beta-barrel protein [Deltaproteobacteria bacterium]
MFASPPSRARLRLARPALFRLSDQAANRLRAAPEQHAGRRAAGKHFYEAMMKKLWAVVCLALLFPAAAAAQELPGRREISWGHLALAPGLAVQEVYDDNIYYGSGSNRTSELKEGDWINHVKPALLLDYSLEERGRVQLGYEGDFARYGHNSFNDWRTHRGLLDIDYRAPGGLIVKIKNTLTDAEDPYGSLNEYGLGRKTMRWLNDFAGTAGFAFSDRFKVLTFYNCFKQRYADREDFTQNYTAAEAGAGGEAKVADKTWLFLRSYAGQQKYDTHRAGVTGSNDASYGWKRVNAGLAWDSEARFEGEVNAGYQWNSFDNSHDKNAVSYKDESSWIAATSVDFRQSDTRTIRLDFSRNLRQLSGGQNGYFMSTGAGLGLSQQINRRMLLLAGYAYTKNKYTSSYDSYSGRKDGIHAARASLNYMLADWLCVGLGYIRLKDSSNNSRDSYTVNRVSISLDMNPAFSGRRP